MTEKCYNDYGYIRLVQWFLNYYTIYEEYFSESA